MSPKRILNADLSDIYLSVQNFFHSKEPVSNFRLKGSDIEGGLNLTHFCLTGS